ncbi:MAG: hypothetical protein JNK85_01830 [Verrucomicrobiales bacterium]|nr:hypothetical protein [Verrucomicrobiales bacterium]
MRASLNIASVAWFRTWATLTFLAWAAIQPAAQAEDAATPPASSKPSALPVRPLQRESPVDFETEILPLFRKNCLACHNQTRAKGDLILETPQTIRKGGASGPSIVEGRAEESLLFRAAAHLAEDMIMPPTGNKANAENLSSNELGLLKLWIDQGAKGEVHNHRPVEWQPMPADWHPAFAAAMTPDGQVAAVSRAHRIDLYHVPTQRPTGSLEDARTPGGAHRDIVNALAFSPDGQWLASAAFREIKLWRRQAMSEGFEAHSTAPAIRVGTGTGANTMTNDVRLAPLLETGESMTVAAVATDSTLAVTVGTNGILKLWRLAFPPTLVREWTGDWRMEWAISTSEQELAFAKGELEFQRGAKKRLDDEVKKAEEALTKATEKHTGNEKTLASKRDERAAQEKAKAAAEKDRAEWIAALEQAGQAAAATDKAAQEAKALAKAAQEKALTSRLSAEQAARAKADLDRLVSDLAGKTDEGAVQKARELAAVAATDAANKFKEAEAQRLEAERRIEDVASRAFDAGAAKSTANRVQADLPPQIKQAEERTAAAVKALAVLDGQIKKAEIAVTTAAGDLDLARNALDKLRRDLTDTVNALARAESSQTHAVAAAAASVQTRDAAAVEPVRFVAFSPGGTAVLAATASGRLRAWLTTDGSPIESWTSSHAPILGIQWRDESRVAVQSVDGTETFRLEPRWTLHRTLGGEDTGSPLRDRVTALAFSPDGSELVSGGGEASRGGELLVWPMADNATPRDLGAPHSDTILAVAYAPGGDRLLTGGADRFARLLDAKTGKVLRQFEGHTHHVMGVAWTRNGRTIATGGADGVVKIWNPITGERIKNVDGFGKEVVAVLAVGTLEQFVAVAGSGQARWFNVAGEKVRQHDGGGFFLHSMAASADGRVLVAGDADGVARVWQGTEVKPSAEWKPERGATVTLSR